jgi:hypothetical protein
VNDSDQPIEDAKLRFIGNTYEGYSYSIGGDGKISSAPIVRAQDFSEFAPSSDVITDKRGHFSANDFPSDLKRLKVTVETPDGTPHSFGTEDHRLSTENLPPVSIRELRAGRARLKIAAGVDLSGIVVDANGIAVEGAAVVESVGNGNLRILSRKTTDARGAFHLANQQEREVLLGASAEGHGSVSTLVTISKGMEVVRLQLPMETPLVGRVTDQQGSPIADAHVGLIDYMNDGIGLEWGAETLADGRFVWTGAPTNELILYVTAEGYAPQLARAKAGPKEHVIRLQAGVRERLRFTGTVTDADTGEPIDQFTVMARDIEKWGSVLRPSYLRARAEGRKGEFSVELNLAELEIRSDVALGVVIDAEGYETALSERSFVQEGDRHFEIKMHRGGMIRGDVRSADGQMAPGATVVLALVDSGAGLNQESGSFNGNFKTQADTQGHFEIQKQVTATYCAVSHDSGWALQKIPDGNETMNVTLQPWASVHIRFDRSTPHGLGSRVHLWSFDRSADNPLGIVLSAPADSEEFEFPHLPAGNFVASLVPMTRSGMTYFYTLQTNFSLVAGERRVIELESEGTQVTAKLKLASGSIPKDDKVATLTRDVAIPKQRGAEYFATSESSRIGSKRFWNDPTIIAARGQERSYFGKVDESGRVTFGAVPAGRYIFECKQLADGDENARQEPKVIAGTRATIEIAATDAQDIGCFELEEK